jgi:organic hydroperoxide reductase OsmC/OhrA
MDAYPHHYRVRAAAQSEGDVALASERLPNLSSAPPAQFGGPGDRWSPETLLVAASADCLILTFRAIARASKLPWLRVDCDAEGVLDRVEGVTRFTQMRLNVRLVLPQGGDAARAQHLLEKAEKTCLITCSLKAESVLTADVTSGS